MGLNTLELVLLGSGPEVRLCRELLSQMFMALDELRQVV